MAVFNDPGKLPLYSGVTTTNASAAASHGARSRTAGGAGSPATSGRRASARSITSASMRPPRLVSSHSQRAGTGPNRPRRMLAMTITNRRWFSLILGVTSPRLAPASPQQWSAFRAGVPVPFPPDVAPAGTPGSPAERRSSSRTGTIRRCRLGEHLAPDPVRGRPEVGCVPPAAGDDCARIASAWPGRSRIQAGACSRGTCRRAPAPPVRPGRESTAHAEDAIAATPRRPADAHDGVAAGQQRVLGRSPPPGRRRHVGDALSSTASASRDHLDVGVGEELERVDQDRVRSPA